MNARVPAEVFPPGEFLREELEARDWSQQELADILDRPPRLISELIAGKRAITPETAKGLGEAFGTSPDYWMNLESQYQLSKVTVPNDNVARKAHLYTQFPVREMLRRGWVQASERVEVLEQRFCEFFDISDVSATPQLSHAAKKSHAMADATPLQLAWLFRVRAIASQQVAPTYSKAKLLSAIEKLRALTMAPEEVRHVPCILADTGVRLVFVEALTSSKMDGACFWLDGTKPVIGMTLRFDRIDNFWFVLRHEIEHVLQEDGKAENRAVIDTDVGALKDGLPECELRANAAGADFCVTTAELDDFVARVQPYFSEERVLRFAQRIQVHPGLVVGQLQRRLDRHDFLRKHQVKVRSFVLPSADVDGWGSFTE
ncbi:HigA family addiction module antitoxin [Hydrogenophaga sp. PBL-H3]|uniref:HigA family addiction module antitoxin n=1 Tax=Hydrogenophaga sp. PBL-H3 TaxID=434010 RepID=UPI00131F8832|nr:HigA family addiction module antitoxin [Hydrogenophaga sp. PBL-H3]QHE74552.1 HigA family addiction module antidote protein [Hydrogenophaga sp. PBL-H3]QHE78977.1 HigA family addiction module antidote protein [Hydrogenophaga sp. PBL-H3]